jgi:hypothetical protein
MDIYAQKGSKVRYLGTGGYQGERDRIEALGVKKGDILTVRYTNVDNWHTDAYFFEIERGHNSVMFEDVEND